MTTRRRVGVGGGILLAVVLVLGACAAGPNVDVAPSGAGFWLGFWHGIILPVTFVISLFTDSVTMYEVDNNGNWYDFGFVLGLALFAGPATVGGRRSR